MQPIAYCWVDSSESLQQACQKAQQKSVVVLDTEFVRTRSYYPKLGLIQMFDGETVSLIDPISITDFTPFVALLADADLTKILHACGEDLEVFQHYFKQCPTPMLDTQIMAGFAGFGVSAGFAKLVNQFLGVSLDKGASRTNWLSRPLTETQLHYAAADVWYLLPLYEKLSQALSQTKWRDAVTQECITLLEKRQEALNPDKAYQEISNAWQLEPQQLAVLQILAKWRQEEAQRRDLALNFVIKEQHLWQIAKIQPKHTSTLLEFMYPNEVRIHGKKLLWLVEKGRAVEPKHYPKPIVRLIDNPHYKKTIKTLQQKLADIQPLDLAPELLASKRQLNQLFRWHQKGTNSEHLPELLIGWRREYGLKLLETVLNEN